MSIGIRQFNLENSEGEVYTLTVSNKYTGFMTMADGLGYEMSPDYQKVGTEYERLADNINQGIISGSIHFFQPYAYREFSKFALFCQDKDLKLYYRTPTGQFKRNGMISKIERSEGSDSLNVKVTFTATSLWYQEFKESVSDDSITVISESALDSLCEISFKGLTITNGDLEWSQKLNNTQVMSGKLSGVTIAATDTVYIRTDKNPYEIYKVNSGGVRTDLYSKSDFSTKRFPLIYKGVNEFIVTGASEIVIKGRILYEAV